MTCWITCQIGAREHYAIPRTLHHAKVLQHLVTDVWVPPQSLLGRLPRSAFGSLKERFHNDLRDASVHHHTMHALALELRLQRNKDPWQPILTRNTWFQHRTCNTLKQLIKDLPQRDRVVFLAYSYAALDLLRFAKAQGWYTVLGQIDPGIVENSIVFQEHQRHPELAPLFIEPFPIYWQQWKEECLLADQIMVNSTWSKQALEDIGISASKLLVVPLAYTPPSQDQTFQRHYPEQFNRDRPLRILFLGQVILRKGIAALIHSAQALRDRPVEFWIVGSLGIIPPKIANVHWIGPVPRSEVKQYYQDADVFLFPTLSDRFGLTQLEAQTWKLPIIASKYCGEVVQDHINGLLLPEVSGEAIADAILSCLNNPQQLQKYSDASINQTEYSVEKLYTNLQTVSNASI